MGADLLNKEEEAMISFVKLATLLPETNYKNSIISLVAPKLHF